MLARCAIVRQKTASLVFRQSIAILPWTAAPYLRSRPGSIGNSQLVSSMAKTYRSKGRPLKEQGKRIRKIDVRFTQDEYDIILELEKTLGVSKTDLVRTRLLQDARLTIVNTKELIGFLDSIGAEMGRCGNNINQLAKYANILRKKGVVSPVVSERFNLLFEQYIAKQEALETALRKVIRLAGI